jgi:hypothetical protein
MNCENWFHNRPKMKLNMIKLSAQSVNNRYMSQSRLLDVKIPETFSGQLQIQNRISS